MTPSPAPHAAPAPQQAHPFDRLALQYDELWTQSAVGTRERESVWRVIDRLFAPGSLVIDIGCGTGADAVHLARRGVRVHATDAAAEMIRMTRARVHEQGLDELVTAEVRPLGSLPAGDFDGALLNFGVLNCVEDLAAAARVLAQVVRPAAPLALCYMGRFYLWETLRWALNPAKATRRWSGGPVMTALGLAVRYPSMQEIRKAFRPYFRVIGRQGIGVFAPFSQAGHLLDCRVAHWPGLRAIGDHQLVVLERHGPRPGVLLRSVCPEQGGILRALDPERREAYAGFLKDYSSIRHAEGRGSDNPDYYLALPDRDVTGRLSGQWAMRAKTFRYFERKVLAPLERCAPQGLNVLDLGAGAGWLSYRLALRGHRPVAVDILTDPLDGLAAARHYRSRIDFPVYEAEFDALPFADGQFDLAIFNAAFHYSTDYRRTLLEVKRCLRRSGRFVILDTPIYRKAQHGERMRQERHDRFQKQYGFRSDRIASIEYLDTPALAALAHDLKIHWRIYRPWYGLQWFMRPWKARWKRTRPPSRFWILEGRFSGV